MLFLESNGCVGYTILIYSRIRISQLMRHVANIKYLELYWKADSAHLLVHLCIRKEVQDAILFLSTNLCLYYFKMRHIPSA